MSSVSLSKICLILVVMILTECHLKISLTLHILIVVVIDFLRYVLTIRLIKNISIKIIYFIFYY
jgi:uncharacterized protein (DUF983 family)